MKTLNKLLYIDDIKRLNFRSDINGLRAIAVVSVVLYHADVNTLKGGWLGVDIFFVISGYLISNIVISELNTNSFSFKNFYLRRVKRIIPALISTILISFCFAYYLLTPKAMIEFLKSIRPSLFFYSNIHFQNLDFYISESTKTMPLIHTWSLAIEEQFYILFPIVCFLVFKYFKKYFFLFFSTLFFVSIYLNYLEKSYIKFYQPQFRMWEIVLGILIMITGQKITQIKHLEKIGLIMALAPLFLFDDTWINEIEPKVISLFGIAIFILFNNKKSVITKFLENKLIKNIGLSSYSIYLFHQPLFSFYRVYMNSSAEVSYETYKLGVISKINIFNSFSLSSILLLLIFCSYFHYKIVELKIPRIKFFLSFIAFFFVLLILVSNRGISSSGFIDRYQTPLTKSALEYQNLDKFDLIVNNEICHKTSLEQEVKSLCRIDKATPNIDIFIIGDSHSRLFLKPFSNLIESNSIYSATGSSCIFFTNTINTHCKRSDNEIISKKLNNIENNIIIFFADLQDKVNDPSRNVLVNYPITINNLAKKNYVIIIKQIPQFPVNVSNRIISNNGRENSVKFKSLEWELNENRIIVENMYKQLTNKNIFFIDTFNIFCKEIENNMCVGSDETNVYFYDDNHLTDKGHMKIIPKILEKIEYINSLNE